MAGQKGADDNLPRFIDGFEPPASAAPKAGSSEPDEPLDLPETPLELPDVSGLDITIETSGRFFLHRAGESDEAGADDELADLPPPPVRQDQTLEETAATKTATRTAKAPAPPPPPELPPAHKAINGLLRMIWRCWFDDLTKLKRQVSLGTDSRELACVAAAVTVIEVASMLHDHAGEDYADQCGDSVEATRATLIERLATLQPALGQVDLKPLIAGLAAVVEQGDTAARKTALWKILSSTVDVSFRLDMYTYYCRPVLDRIRVRMAAATAH